MSDSRLCWRNPRVCCFSSIWGVVVSRCVHVIVIDRLCIGETSAHIDDVLWTWVPMPTTRSCHSHPLHDMMSYQLLDLSNHMVLWHKRVSGI